MNRFVVTSEASYEDGRVFGQAGPYRLVRGVADVVIDPRAAVNAEIADLGLAEPDGEGRLHVQSDVLLLRPANDGQANGMLLTVVPNRGTVGDVPLSIHHGPRPPHVLNGPPRAGDGFLLGKGWTIAWIGWQWDVLRDGEALGCAVPAAVDHGTRTDEGWCELIMRPTTWMPSHPLNSLGPGWDQVAPATRFRAYSTAELEDGDATLVEVHEDGAQQQVARNQWRFARDEGAGPVPDRDHVWLAGGFRPGRVYTLRYRTETCPVVGAGLLAFRDVASMLRYGPAPDDRTTRGVVAWGVSQSGRFLRELLYRGLNVDAHGRPVFDCVVPVLAGARRGEFNQRFGKPGEAFPTGPQPPYALDGSDGSLLMRLRRGDRAPKVMLINSGSEYWRGDAALTHISPDGAQDLPERPDTRVYLVAGTDHEGGEAAALARQACSPNPVSPTVVWRALFVAAERWVRDGEPPPPSCVPRCADGSAVPRQQILDRVRRYLPQIATSFSPAAVLAAATEFVTMVADVDADLNERAGVLPPEVAAPLATYLPWTTPAALGKDNASLTPLRGQMVPFQVSTTGGDALQDPRQAILERYPTIDDYLHTVRAAISTLVRSRFMLPEDEDTVMAAAERRYRTSTLTQP